jgi:hypothetical protein
LNDAGVFKQAHISLSVDGGYSTELADTTLLDQHNHVLLVAIGTGVTPMLSWLRRFSEQNSGTPSAGRNLVTKVTCHFRGMKPNYWEAVQANMNTSNDTFSAENAEYKVDVAGQNKGHAVFWNRIRTTIEAANTEAGEGHIRRIAVCYCGGYDNYITMKMELAGLLESIYVYKEVFDYDQLSYITGIRALMRVGYRNCIGCDKSVSTAVASHPIAVGAGDQTVANPTAAVNQPVEI